MYGWSRAPSVPFSCIAAVSLLMLCDDPPSPRPHVTTCRSCCYLLRQAAHSEGETDCCPTPHPCSPSPSQLEPMLCPRVCPLMFFLHQLLSVESSDAPALTWATQCLLRISDGAVFEGGSPVSKEGRAGALEGEVVPVVFADAAGAIREALEEGLGVFLRPPRLCGGPSEGLLATLALR